ncbi:MAG: MFS family permease, partial [Hyphomicrobiaceae bacterium]
NAAAWALLHFDPQYTAFLAIGALYGVGIGAAGPLHGFVLARCFGPLAFGRAAGIGGLSALPLVAGAPALAGWLYDSTGSYQAVFELEVVLIIVGGLLLSVPRIPKQELVAG